MGRDSCSVPVCRRVTEMELALVVLLRPFLYLLLFAGVVYWVMKFLWWLIPDGKVKTFLFKRRDW